MYFRRLPVAFLLSLGLLNACQMTKPAAPTAATPADAASPAGAAPLYQSAAFTLYPDRLVQGPHTARAVSRTQLTSDYQSPANAFQSPQVNFKFSLNGKDNEMQPGQDHVFVALPPSAGASPLETPVIVFGQQYKDARPVPANTYLASNTPLRIRLDMRPVLTAFQKQGFYQLYNGQKLYKDDFKHVFVAGNTTPLSWDFDNLINKPQLELKDTDGNGIYEATVVLNAHSDAKTTAAEWSQALTTSEFPQYSSGDPLPDALYNLALEEAKGAVEPDGTFRTGKEWAGVWTRDISYSIILAQAILQPEVAKTSLLRKVRNGRIIQDTGTGGAYPCSTDRMIWAVAAWEIYQVTGEESWLRQVYPIIKRSITDDEQNAYDPQTGLVRGESSFLDWREQTYPKWMQPVDIYQSETLGTNAVHFQANQVLTQMAERLGEPAVAAHHQQLAAAIRNGINQHLWQADKGYYAQYLYGRTFPTPSPRAEALGAALSVLYGVADAERAGAVLARTPVMDYGIPCIYPQIPGIPPYHNNAIWPFVQSFWGLAAAQAGHEQAFLHSLATVYRPAALFLTNKENFVASNGDFAGTQVNSSNMLWSLSGSLGLVYKGLFGMQFEADRLVFRPFVPQAMQGTRRLNHFRYRNALLNIELSGFGHNIKSISLDGQPLPVEAVPATLSGTHGLRIVLDNELPTPLPLNRVAHHVSPMTPAATYAAGRLRWAPVEGAKAYQVLRNGQFAARTTETSFAVPTPKAYTEYQVLAIDTEEFESFASEPLAVGAAPRQQLIELADRASKSALPYQGATGLGFVEISTTRHKTLTIKVPAPVAGRYALDFRYANGNGPINTSNKCAFRTLRDGAGRQLGTAVFPQRGVDEWSDWGFSNPILVSLAKGANTLTLIYEPANENMNGEVNQAMLDYLRLTRID